MKAVVIGGGIAGLATAALLAENGARVTVLEGRDEIGGRAGSWEQEGFRFDTGPSWYLMPEVFDRFFALLGTSAAEQLDLALLTPAYRVYAEPEGDGPGERVDVISGRDSVRALFEAREPGSGPRIDAYLDSAADIYHLATSRFLYDPYSDLSILRDRTLLRRIGTLLPLLTRHLGPHVERRFSDPVLRQILGYPAVFLGGSPYGVPSLYHLMSHLDLNQGVLYPRGGFTQVIEAIATLARERGVQLRTGARVTRILTNGTVASGVELENGERIDADAIVSTADLHHTETALLPRRQQTYPQRWWDKRTPGPGALLLMLGVEGEVPELAHHTLLFTAQWREGFEAIFGRDQRIPDPASLYICAPSVTDPTVAPSGMTNLFMLVPIPADPTIGHGGTDGAGDARVEAAADLVIDQIARWAGIPDLADRIRVRRTVAPGDFADDLNSWRGTSLGLAHTLRQSAMFRPNNASRRVRGLYYAGGSALPGIGLPMCLISAELAAGRVERDLAATGSRPVGTA